MKKILFSSLVLLGAAFTSCGDDILTETNLKDNLVTNYYSTQTEVDRALVGVYSELYTGNAINNEVMMANLASDEMFAGGEQGGDFAAKGVDGFKKDGADMFGDVWKSSYRGAFRATQIIDNIGKASYTDTIAQKEDKGEAHFLRAYYYFRLAKYFGGVPVCKNVAEHESGATLGRSSIDDVYAFIAFDLLQAIKLMPSKSAKVIAASEYGKANKWAAEAYLARIYLFYTGYKTNMLGVATTTLPVFGGVALTKADVMGHLDDCIANSGYSLEKDFRSLWPYSKAGEDGHYAWASDCKWAGEGGTLGTGNNEKMFVVRHGKGFWDDGNQKISNILCLYSGVRDLDTKLENVPFGPGGWGWCTVSQTTTKDVFAGEPKDIRKKGSIINYDDADDMNPLYVKSGDQATGLANKKYTQIQWKVGKEMQEMWHTLLVGGTDMQNNDLQDLCLLRFADVLLMDSELKGTAVSMNLVRTRAGIAAVGTYSEATLRLERRREFAFEGLRWFDMLRMGTVAADLAKVNGEKVLSKGVETSYSVTYNAEAKGLWPIPQSEINVTGKYDQNPGW